MTSSEKSSQRTYPEAARAFVSRFWTPDPLARDAYQMAGVLAVLKVGLDVALGNPAFSNVNVAMAVLWTTVAPLMLLNTERDSDD